ncbi:MAG: hypothetical protein RSB05_03350 [Clostridiales bacterium]
MAEKKQHDCGCEKENSTCLNKTAHYAEIGLPLNIIPYATVKKVSTQCCGEPIIAPFSSQSPCGCDIFITQALCIRVEVEYGSTVNQGDATVNCKPNSTCADSYFG